MSDDTGTGTPGGTPADWPPADTTGWRDAWPKTTRVWRVHRAFGVVAHTKEQAEARMDWFEQALYALWTAGYDPHPLVRYVNPAILWDRVPSAETTLDHEETHHEFPHSMMGDTEYYWDWWDPDPEEDDADEVGERTDQQWSAPDDAADRLRHIEHRARAAARFGQRLDPGALLAIIGAPSVDDDATGDGDPGDSQGEPAGRAPVGS